MDPISVALISKALDGLTARSVATARNIANVNSAKYRPVHVTFEEALRSAADRGIDAIRDVTPEVEETPLAIGDSRMRLDLELATATQTGLRYAALIDLLGRQMQISRLVIRGGQ